jgi:uncharacterized protein (TIGR00266 family)
MPFTIRCSCGQALQVREELIGKKVRCSSCQAILKVSEPGISMADEPEEEAPSVRKPARRRPEICHEVDYEIFGDDLQLVEIELDPQETCIAEAGAMTYMEDGIEFFKKLWGAGKRVLGGESMFLTHFTNQGRGKRRVAFGAPYPGKIIPINMMDVDGVLICQKDAFLCAALGTRIGIAFQKKLGVGFFGGEGFILEKIEGDGMAFVHACGCIIQRQLADGERLRVDTGCIVAFTQDVEYDIEKAGSLKSMMFGGEGLFLATLTGPGHVWLQSLPFSRLAERIVGGSRGGKEEGSILGHLGHLGELGRMFGGD